MTGRKSSQTGQTLLEILLAFSASILVLSAIIFGVTTSLSNAQYTKNQNLANFYAQEGMAVVRQIRDSGWKNLSSLEDYSTTTDSTYCLDDDSKKLTPKNSASPVPCGLNVGGVFSREVEFEHDKLDKNNCSGGSKVTVKVSWTDSKCSANTSNPLCHKAELITCFSDLNTKLTP